MKTFNFIFFRKLERISYQLDNERVKLNIMFRRFSVKIDSKDKPNDMDILSEFIDSVPLLPGINDNHLCFLNKIFQF